MPVMPALDAHVLVPVLDTLRGYLSGRSAWSDGAGKVLEPVCWMVCELATVRARLRAQGRRAALTGRGRSGVASPSRARTSRSAAGQEVSVNRTWAVKCCEPEPVRARHEARRGRRSALTGHGRSIGCELVSVRTRLRIRAEAGGQR